jgi:putative hydrolase of the HAD superfamily
MDVPRSSEPPAGGVLALDVDGVLLDPGRAGRGVWQHALRERYGLDPALLDQTFFRTQWPDIVVGRAPIEPALDRTLQELGWGIGVEALLECWFEADFELEGDVVEAVNGWAARGTRVVLATNQEVRRASYLERHLGPVLAFDGMAYSGAIGALKSDPGFYPAAERSLGIAPGGRRVVFVDDARENVDAADRHGWLGIHFSKDHDWRQQIGAALLRPDP